MHSHSHSLGGFGWPIRADSRVSVKSVQPVEGRQQIWNDAYASSSVNPEKKEDNKMFPKYTVKGAGRALRNTPLQYWYFVFENDDDTPIRGFSNHWAAYQAAQDLTKTATEDFAKQLLRTQALKAMAGLDVKTLTTLATERKDADAEKAEVEKVKADWKRKEKVQTLSFADDNYDNYFLD